MDCSCQSPQSMKFSRQEYWRGLPRPSPGDLPNSGIEPGSPELLVDSLPSEPPGNPIRQEHVIKSIHLGKEEDDILQVT